MVRGKQKIPAAVGVTLIACAWSITQIVPASNPPYRQVERCVRDQFAANGFQVALPPSGKTGGSIRGTRPGAPPVTVFFRNPEQAEIRIGDTDGRFAIAASDGLSGIKNLASDIRSACHQVSRAQGGKTSARPG